MAPPAPISHITAVEAAGRLGVSRRRVLALITEGRLPAAKVGFQYLIHPKDLALVRDRKPGRPPKPTSAKKRKKE